MFRRALHFYQEKAMRTLILADIHANLPALRAVLATGRVACFECVEYNPTLDRTGKDRQTLLELFRLVREELEKA